MGLGVGLARLCLLDHPSWGHLMHNGFRALIIHQLLCLVVAPPVIGVMSY